MKIVLGNFDAKLGNRIFLKWQLGMRVYMRVVMIMVLK